MRRRAAVVGLVLAAAIVLGLAHLLREDPSERGARPRPAAAPAANARPAAEDEEEAAAAPCRIVTSTGAPSGEVAVHWVVARPLDTHVYREAEYPPRRVWLVTHHRRVRPDAGGTFPVRRPRLPAGARVLLLADSETSVHGLREAGAEVRFEERVPVRGTVQSDEGPCAQWWLSGRRGVPEDWQARVTRVPDAFIADTGPLDFDPAGEASARTDDAGRFTLHLLPGRNTISFAGWEGDRGSIEIDVPSGGIDLGDFRPPPPPRRGGNHTLRGRVVDLAGLPLERATVELWAGDLDAPSDDTATDSEGRFAFTGVGSGQAIAWVSSTTMPHVWIPEQSSGRIRLPCPPVVLRAPRPDTYTWITSEGIRGHLLVFTGRRWAGDVALDGTERFGLPPDQYHLIVVLRGRILERDLSVREPGEIVLRPQDFRDTTWE